MQQFTKKWKGKCENDTQFSSSNCNKKLIGARSFSKALRATSLKIPPPEEDYDSVRDFQGHGMHTVSTAAGNHVAGTNCFGQARGIAIGVAPRAHIAMYKGLFKTDLENLAGTPDVLAAIDQAIADGVDILSISLGFYQMHYYQDVIAIGALSAALRAIGLKIPPPEEDYDSVRDFQGHGMHTISTAAGNHVVGTNCFGQARGIAIGVAPRAYIAMHKGLFKTDLDNLAGTPDVLAAIDQAIADGVDILSISLGFC
ncbi:hypothetical protein K2173_023124 [Erythroxylum novogranatense]|uniref:Peptidase S8/S53 domain-containing protein n=1 Tax=Erythroxylum novogranatense TaxID=1862640 RepID=A0AAV8UAY1_9ROSI|nr:hypothetical protein K2173_023124 [Erythroxylum novogranatense]